MNKFYIVTLMLSLAFLFPSCENQAGRNRTYQGTSSNTHTQNNEHTRKQPPESIPEQSQATPQHQLPLNQLYNKYKNSVFFIFTSDGANNFLGTGFFISKSGLAVSNYHVFEGTTKGLEVIQTTDENQFNVLKILDQSKEYDYIIFQVDKGDYHISNPIPIASQSPQIGDDVFAIGNPEGLANTLSKGIISGYRENNSRIQTTAEITHGSSGGPLMNMNGEVIGITTSGYGEANLNFAINIKLLKLDRFK